MLAFGVKIITAWPPERAGSLISVPITADDPPDSEGRGAVVYIDLNGFEVIEEGPSPD